MADNNTFVLFEEIKNKLETIYRELKELKEKENGSISLTTPSTPAQSDEQKEQELRQFGIRKFSKKLVISLLFCNFIVENQSLTKHI